MSPLAIEQLLTSHALQVHMSIRSYYFALPLANCDIENPWVF
jgi:hypothetical protein